MTTRLGIELSPAACRIVEVETGMAWHRRASDTRVRSFAVLPLSGAETRAKLNSLRKQPAAVVVWNAPSDQRQVVVNRGSYESMRAEALGALADVGLPTRGVWADIAPASHPANRSARQSVVVALAAATEMSAALQPIIDAGIRVLTVTTPAMALESLARLRRPFSIPDTIDAYVALEEDRTCIALVRASVLVVAHELAWGYIDEGQPRRQPRQKDDIAKRLGDAITDFIAGIGGSVTDIGHVCVCGGLPELRSMAALLMERFDVEVEPLDSLFGIDATRLPAPADEFRERGAELKLAWAVASDWPAPINLLRFRKRQASTRALARAAVATGMAAGLVLGWRIERSQAWRWIETKRAARTATIEQVRARSAVRGASPSGVAASKPVVAPPPAVVASKPLVAPPPAVVASRPVAQPVASRPPSAPMAPVVANPPGGALSRQFEAPARAETASILALPAVMNMAPSEDRPRPAGHALATVRPTAPTHAAAVAPLMAQQEPAPPRARLAPAAEAALPFDAVLGSILYSPDRKLAIVDGGIVTTGDEVRGGRIVEIRPDAVILRDAQGQVRRLRLGVGVR